MSGVFYVFLKWASDKPVEAAHFGRYMFCLPSRYEADKLFRAMQELQTANGKGPLFTLLERQTPQFWCYDSPENWPAIRDFQVRNSLPQFKNTLSSLLLPDLEGRGWPTIPNPIGGPDWVSGGEFFIRNRRQPNLYWNVHDTHIHMSEQRRSKFIVRTTATNLRKPAILITTDEITLQVIPETVSPALADNNRIYVTVGGSPGNRIQLSQNPREWTFGGLLNKEVGVKWESDQAATTTPVLVHLPVQGGDEWELV